MLALFVGVVPATQCVDTDVGLAASERYVLRLTEEAEQVDWIDLAFGNCSSDMALFAETRQLSIAEACGLVHRTIKVYTFGKTSLGSVAKLLGDYDVPADFDRGDDLLDVWCGFTCDSSCPGHPPAAPPLPPREPRAHAPDGADPTLFGFAAWDDEWLPLAPYGWLVQMWCVAIAVQAVAAVLIYLRHRHFMSAWRRFKCDSGARPSLRSNERSAHNPNDIELHSAAPSETQGARTPARVAPVMADSEQVAQTAETGRKSQLSLPRSHAELSLAFRNVSYETSAGTQLLADLTGCVLPGELVAIMGESGAGKTTCLSVLAGRHGPGRVQGQVFVNGERREPGSSAGRLFAAHSGYMLQATGALCDELSARENLAYASLMRLPAATALETRFARIEQILLELELAGVADLRVGSVDDPRGGLSGGQRRRLMLAIQLLSLPTCLFADEPTSGLDARAAQEVMWLLTAYARTGRSVVLSVHQPRAESFAGFDRLLLLHRGRVAFCGAPHDGPAFVLACASILRDGRRPSRDEAANPADVLLDLLAETDGSGVSVGDFAVAVAHACDLHAASVSEAEQVQARTTRLNAHGGGSCCAAARASVQATLTRLWALESRLLRRKSYTSYGVLSLQLALFAAILGSVYFDASESYVIAGQLYKLVDAPSQVLQAQVAILFYEGLSGVYRHERAAGACSPALLLLQHQLHCLAWILPPQLLFATTLFTCTYRPADAHSLLLTLLFGAFDAMVYVAFFMAVCVVARLLTRSSSVTPAVIGCAAVRGLFSFFSGYFISPAHTPWFWRWIYYISPTYWSYSAIFAVNFATRLDLAYLALYGYDAVDPAKNAAILCVMWVGYLLVAWLLLCADEGRFDAAVARCVFRVKAPSHGRKLAITQECAAKAEAAASSDAISARLRSLWVGRG